MFSFFWSLLIGIVYLASMALPMAALYKCNSTDPGIIPAVRDPAVDPKKDYCKPHVSQASLDVEYRDQGERANQTSQV